MIIGGTILADESKNPVSLKMVEEFFEDIVNHYVTNPDKKKEARCKLRIFEAFFEDMYSRTNRMERELKELLKNNERVENIIEMVEHFGNSNEVEDMKNDIESNSDRINDLEQKINDIESNVRDHNDDIRSIRDSLD